MGGTAKPTAFVYDCNRDCFVCPEGKLLGYEGRHTKKKGFTYYRYEAEWRDYQGCARKSQCCPENQKQGRSVVRGEESAAVLAFQKKMASEEAQAQYAAVGESWNFATRGSKASWVCGSFTSEGW